MATLETGGFSMPARRSNPSNDRSAESDQGDEIRSAAVR